MGILEILSNENTQREIIEKAYYKGQEDMRRVIGICNYKHAHTSPKDFEKEYGTGNLWTAITNLPVKTTQEDE